MRGGVDQKRPKHSGLLMETETQALCTHSNGPVRGGVEMMSPARVFGLGKLSHYLLELHIICSQVELDYHRISLRCPGRVS